MIDTVGKVKELNARMGLHFFDSETMRFWGSRISPLVLPIPDGAVFITSEMNYDGTRRLYSTRTIDAESGMVDTHAWQAYETLSAAKSAARRLAKDLNERH